MKTEQMTVHEALAELKMLDTRVDRKINEASFAIGNKKTNKKIGGKTVAEYMADANAAYQSITDLIRRRQAIRSALSKSNAETHVTIAGVDYSVAEAIEMKRSGMSLWSELHQQMMIQYNAAKADCNRQNSNLDAKADQQVSAIFGTKEKVTTAEAMAMRDAYIEANRMEPVALECIEKKLAEIEDMMSAFAVEVDSKLSVSNALTTITINY